MEGWRTPVATIAVKVVSNNKSRRLNCNRRIVCHSRSNTESHPPHGSIQHMVRISSGGLVQRVVTFALAALFIPLTCPAEEAGPKRAANYSPPARVVSPDFAPSDIMENFFEAPACGGPSRY